MLYISNIRLKVWDTRSTPFVRCTINNRSICSRDLFYTWIDDCNTQPASNIGPLSARQRNAIRWRFAGGPIVVHFTCLLGCLVRTCAPDPRGEGGTLIFSYIRRLGSLFWVHNFEFQYFWGVFRKINMFWGMKILWIFYEGHHRIGLYLAIISMHVGSFLKVMVQNGDIFWGLLKFQIVFWGCLEFLIFWGVKGRCLARAYVWKKMRVHVPAPG